RRAWFPSSCQEGGTYTEGAEEGQEQRRTTCQARQGGSSGARHAPKFFTRREGFAFFGLRRFAAALFLCFFHRKQSKQSGGKAPHSKKRQAPSGSRRSSLRLLYARGRRAPRANYFVATPRYR